MISSGRNSATFVLLQGMNQNIKTMEKEETLNGSNPMYLLSRLRLMQTYVSSNSKKIITFQPRIKTEKKANQESQKTEKRKLG